METYICHDCGCSEGQLHEPGCDMERCPRCGGQYISCACLDAKYTAYLRDKLPRVPYIQYPNVCAKCGKLWPDLFMVPSAEWKHYIEKDMQDKVICRECYDWIKKIIDENEAKK